MKSVGKKPRYLWALLFAAALTILGCMPALANTIATASVLPVNGTKTGKISVNESGTYYKFTVDTAGELTIEALQYCDNVHVMVVDKDEMPIYDSANTPFVCHFANMHGTETSPRKYSVALYLPKGTYWLKLQAPAGETVNVNVGLTHASYGVNPVMGDSHDNPVMVDIKSGGTGCMSYKLYGSDDAWYSAHQNFEDWYKISVPATGNYQFKLDRKGRTWSPYFTLYDKDMNRVYFSFDSDVLLTKGSYYMEVKTSDNSDDMGKAGYYHFFGVRTYPAKGAVITDGKLNYKVTKAGLTGGKLEATGTGDYFYQNPNCKKLNIPNTTTIDGITYSVTSIASYAFNGKNRFTTITVGDNVTKIGQNGFYGCTGCKNLTIGKGLTTIGAHAFADCYKLKTVKIKSTKIKTVKTQAFYNSPKKTTFKVPKAKVKAYKKKFRKAGANSKKFKKL
ncbi:MAG: leucine-rich repeat domain-containing protein [Lachnospiraceae bacterium]|nr:leucine-rich repeat domain-containing protein [Lachnospiraceae bacterium]